MSSARRFSNPSWRRLEYGRLLGSAQTRSTRWGREGSQPETATSSRKVKSSRARGLCMGWVNDNESGVGSYFQSSVTGHQTTDCRPVTGDWRLLPHPSHILEQRGG